MTNTETYKYSVGTANTGSFVDYATLEEARAEAIDWARSEPRTIIYVWACNEQGEIIDTVDNYCTP